MRICTKGKPCGKTCIPLERTCRNACCSGGCCAVVGEVVEEEPEPEFTCEVEEEEPVGCGCG